MINCCLVKCFPLSRSIEAAAMIYKEAKNFDEAADLVEQASALYLEHGVPDTAAISLERAAKSVSMLLLPINIIIYYKDNNVA